MSEHKRRDAEKTAGGRPEKVIKKARAKRSREWDTKHNRAVATYRLTVELKQEIRALADELGVSPAVIVKMFLEHGLEEYRAGNIELE
jgi:hypothetical protein